MNKIDDKAAKLNSDIAAIVGNKAWNAKIGHGSFITIEFGRPLVSRNCESHGEWNLWVYMCSWRIEKDGNFLAGSGDSEENMTEAVKQIDGCRLTSFSVSSPFLDSILSFEQGIVLRLFSVYSDHDDNESVQHWILYMPDNKVIVAGPGSRWIIEETSTEGEII